MNTKRTPDLDDLDPETRSALLDFKQQNGRYWKDALNQHWQNGTDAKQPGGSFLRRVRNNFGPTWLSKLRID